MFVVLRENYNLWNDECLWQELAPLRRSQDYRKFDIHTIFILVLEIILTCSFRHAQTWSSVGLKAISYTWVCRIQCCLVPFLSG